MKRTAVILIEVEDDEAPVAEAVIKLIVDPNLQPGQNSLSRDIAMRMISSERSVPPAGQACGQIMGQA